MFLGKTQKEEIIMELKIIGDEASVGTIEEIEKYGVDAECLLFTDVDNQQVAIKITEDIWIYSQQDKFFYDWHEDSERDAREYKTETINLADYSVSEVENNVKYFYDSLEKMKKECKQDWKQIACECIFEN
ncbi:hypothetical protein [Sulfurimonas indica]|uniref:hypothetical protein n=1 Tax=Sulfurimonas TaxID=202746 RepID=UPI001264398C|nr:hypothetical protein [Sulfurimonas indica]